MPGAKATGEVKDALGGKAGQIKSGQPTHMLDGLHPKLYAL